MEIMIASDIVAAFRRSRRLSTGVARMLGRLQRLKPINIIVHNRRDAADFRHVYGFERVFDHPLAFLSVEDAETSVAGASRRRFPLLDKLPGEAVLVGVFGFINDYNGFGTAVRALYHLPKTYHHGDSGNGS